MRRGSVNLIAAWLLLSSSVICLELDDDGLAATKKPTAKKKLLLDAEAINNRTESTWYSYDVEKNGVTRPADFEQQQNDGAVSLSNDTLINRNATTVDNKSDWIIVFKNITSHEQKLNNKNQQDAFKTSKKTHMKLEDNNYNHKLLLEDNDKLDNTEEKLLDSHEQLSSQKTVKKPTIADETKSLMKPTTTTKSPAAEVTILNKIEDAGLLLSQLNVTDESPDEDSTTSVTTQQQIITTTESIEWDKEDLDLLMETVKSSEEQQTTLESSSTVVTLDVDVAEEEDSPATTMNFPTTVQQESTTTVTPWEINNETESGGLTGSRTTSSPATNITVSTTTVTSSESTLTSESTTVSDLKSDSSTESTTIGLELIITSTSTELPRSHDTTTTTPNPTTATVPPPPTAASTTTVAHTNRTKLEVPTTSTTTTTTTTTTSTTTIAPVTIKTTTTTVATTTPKPTTTMETTTVKQQQRVTTTSTTTTTEIPAIKSVTPTVADLPPPDTKSPSKRITSMVRIVFEGGWREVCPRLETLQRALAELLSSGLDRQVDHDQIIFQEVHCKELEPTASSANNELTLTSVFVYVVDEYGDFDAELTESLPKLLKVSSINFLTIRSLHLVQDNDTGNAIVVIIVSSVALICLFILAILLFIIRKRQTRFNYGERCRPVSLDAFSLDSVSAYNSVRRKGANRDSKRSYGNPTFDDSSAAPSHPLNYAGLSSFCKEKSAIANEFQAIPQVTAKIDELPAGAEVKNRYANVIPFPETRVPLLKINNDPLSEYINANYVRGPKNSPKYYIASQAPMESTVVDFWRMVWEQQVKVVVMLTDLAENGVEKCAEYIPPSEITDCHRLYGDYQVTLKKRESKEKYAISTVQLKNLENNTFREVWHIWYLWPSNGQEVDGAGLIAMLLEARALQRSNAAPVVVHCSPGNGRTGTVIALDLCIRQYEITRTVDVPRIVYSIRRDRSGAVQTQQQYAFIYKALQLYASKLAGGALEPS